MRESYCTLCTAQSVLLVSAGGCCGHRVSKSNSLDFIGHLFLSVPSPPQYEQEEEHDGHQAQNGSQSSSDHHACIGSWEMDHRQYLRSVLTAVVGESFFYLIAYVQVITSRLMEQLSEPAVLLARHTYLPDMLLVRLLSLRVPCLSSAKRANKCIWVMPSRVVLLSPRKLWTIHSVLCHNLKLLGAVELGQIYETEVDIATGRDFIHVVQLSRG